VILLLDHDDSFVYTLARYIEELGEAPVVLRTQGVTLDVVRAMAPTRIILSPGPGTPEACTLALAVVRTLGPTTPILGVCLGHQVIATAHGATVARAAHPRHGRTSPVTHDGLGVFAGLPTPFDATRYHSLAVVEASVPGDLLVTAHADDGEVMGIRHATHPVEGVQFHPESVLTTMGMAMMRNFLSAAAVRPR
jgi:anthranilate synthase/aminodeoxychorismate synthase-like glutamine amidotransferase